jgi:hypothetical protein
MSRKVITLAPAVEVPVVPTEPVHSVRPSSLTLTRTSHVEILTRLTRDFFNGKSVPQIVNGTPILEYLASLQWDRSPFPGTDIPARLNCAASPAQVNEVAATLRSRVLESL